MTHTKHTPGPWKVQLFDTAWEILARDGEAIALNASAYTDFGVPSEHEANARLIAAAPELLTRLRDHVEHGPGIEGGTCPCCGRDNSSYQNTCTSDDCMGVLDRAAIAKADGH